MRGLARKLGYSHSRLSDTENDRKACSYAFVEACDTFFAAGGELIRHWYSRSACYRVWIDQDLYEQLEQRARLEQRPIDQLLHDAICGYVQTATAGHQDERKGCDEPT